MSNDPHIPTHNMSNDQFPSEHDRWRPQPGTYRSSDVADSVSTDPIPSIEHLTVEHLTVEYPTGEHPTVESVPTPSYTFDSDQPAAVSNPPHDLWLVSQPAPPAAGSAAAPSTWSSAAAATVAGSPTVTGSPAPTREHVPSSTWGHVPPPPPPSGPRSSGSSTPPTPAPRQSWVKPALVGGLIGSLLSGAVSAGAVFATRSSTKQAATVATSVPVVKTSSGNSKPKVVLADDPSPLKRALREVAPSVVAIMVEGAPTRDVFGSGSPSEAAGSGVIVSADGLVLTNAHVVEGAQTIIVTLADRSSKPATLVGSDPDNDVALVRITGAKDLPAATLGESAKTEVGDQVFAVGNALALDGGPSVTSGIVSALDRDISDPQTRLRGLIQTDAAINPGNSGGPLVNLDGAVVGMNTAIIQNSNNIGFAIPIDRIKPMLIDLKTFNGTVKPRPFLGVSTISVAGLSDAERTKNGITATKGAAIDSIVNGSPAATAGLRPGDVITTFDGKSVEKSEELVGWVRDHKVGDDVKIGWKRGGTDMNATIKLGSTKRTAN
jgi:serine protease Do